MVHGIPSQLYYAPLVIMSLTNWCDRLTLLSYATFNYHSPIHDHEDQWKQTETMVALASLALQSAKKLFQKGSLENKRLVLTMSGADVRWYWFLHVLGT